MGVRRYHVERDAVKAEHIPGGEIPWVDLKGLKMGTVTVDPPSIAAGASGDVDVTVSGLTTDHKVIAMCQTFLDVGLVPQAAWVPSANTLRIRLYNPTGAAINGLAREWFYIAWIP